MTPHSRRTSAALTLTLSLGLMAGVAQAQTKTQTDAQAMTITHAEARNTRVGGDDLFVGHALINPLFDSTDHTQATAAEVTFAPGARSNWHTHPAGQTLVVTSGSGWIQQEGGERREMHAGDVIWTPPASNTGTARPQHTP